ncbi:flagellar basal body P-ring protein FlgI [Vibrio alginolyticus]|uniref:flagellar basal body P-ring protein FlgI n=1 Tax=Vibrio sp. B1FLJ16 TaxID=2751178 RepID=UPI0015F63116|nr:flagellar basal body P-ring protein FlgI [Vibrio sp. B1FLJ16]MCA0935673.1 flagellar basal body P-ring protein FlgI [Vibrio alginolyticus]CAD7801231.1 Assembles around the rod to form the L-ring and probably protects the motor basal body from shearing forces during rotation [Vibrio sp. B1FLJ16]CAD7801272.1 Assembles around the rod to form the L-ring and probably protects the motor basal body from shearing forces during rotation [Vibrio sp. B1FLJ16]CAE6889630.1 Assembles around the rod to form
MKRILLILMSMALFSTAAQAARIKDVAQVAGVRSNQLVGYGLVSGLPGTGESNPFTEQSFAAMLQNFGIQLPPGTKPKIKNVAAVMVTATLPPFSKPGQQVDVTISSIGSAKSLRGGTLLQTFLKGLDGQVYAVAQGNLVVSGFSAEGNDGSKIVGNNPTVGIISSGATVEREIPNPFGRGDYITFNLLESDFTTAQRMADAVNNFLGPQMASAVDATSVRVRAPRDVSQRVAFLSAIENLEFDPADGAAKIIVNSRTGTIVVGKHVRLKSAAVTHGGMTVAIKENLSVSQPNGFSGGQTVVVPDSDIEVTEKQGKMFKFDPGLTLDDLVRAVNEVGAAPSDLMAILQALKQAGAIEGQLIII